MKREADPAARRVTIRIGETSRLTIDRFDDYDEVVELHVYWHPGIRARGLVLDISAMVDKEAELQRVVQLAHMEGEVAVEMADLLQPHAHTELPRDVNVAAREILINVLNNDDHPLWEMAKADVAERGRRRSPPSVDDLRALVDVWDSAYDGYTTTKGRKVVAKKFASGDERKAAVAKHLGCSVRTLDEKLRAAKKAGLKYRGMRR